MTEVVTSSAAFQQLNLLAPRQQVFVVERQGVDSGFATADTAPTSVETSSDSLSHFDSSGNDQNPVNHHQDQAPAPSRPDPAISGPSKARIEIKHIDLGLTPSEVVGTPDILQRFDNNGDGRVDLIEAARAGLAREGVFTFAGLAGGSQTDESAAPAPAPILEPVSTAVTPDAAQPVAIEPGDKKLFTGADVPATAQTKKFFVAAQAAAAQGTASGIADAPKKFYGQGAEVVVGKFAVADTQPKFVEKAAEKPHVVITEDSGETKVHTKVAQTDTDQAQGKAGGDTPSGSTYEKAKAIEADGPSKKVLVEVTAYADASAIIDAAASEAAATAVTA